MIPFLKQVATLFFDKYGSDIHRLAFVFPNRRSGIFFRKYLSEVAEKPVFSPSILTISDLFHKINPKQQADNIQLLFILYDIYIKQSHSNETFDDFVYWGEMLLNDFDDVDKYLVDAKQLFTNVTDLNNIEKEFGFLQPSQIEAVRTFWSSFKPKDNAHNQQSFLYLWELLYPIYKEFQEKLSIEGFSYEGMIYREAIEIVKKGDCCLSYDKIIFVGLNALTTAERELFQLLKAQSVADFYWDYSSDKLRDENNRASFFMKNNVTMFPSEFSLPEEKTEETEFELIGIPSRIGQAKQLYSLIENRSIKSDNALQTAIVLPDEQLLIPVLNAIPGQIERINVTLGYSLSGTPIVSLMNTLQSLQKNMRKIDDAIMFYHSDVVSVLRHKYVVSVCSDEAFAIIKEITDGNRVYVQASLLWRTPLLKLLFSAPSDAIGISDYLTAVLKELNNSLLMSKTDEDAVDEENKTVDANSFEKEFIFHYYTMVNRMKDMMSKTGTKMSSDTYFHLLKQITDFIKIPFRGEPLSGLQIMGVLETRVLDFENIIILSMNEGVFPSKSSANSFIPYHLRRGFGLPTQEHQDSIWAYHFYRMIYRAKHVTMLYDTRTGGLQSGEVSRFVHQLKYHYKTPIRQKLSVYNVSSSQVEPIRVEKDAEIMSVLASYEKNKALSASAINVYLDCPLKFYFSYIKGIDEAVEVSETLEYDTFGTVLHRVMELIYKPLCGKVITADILELIAKEKNMTEIIQQAFALDFFHTEQSQPLVGQTYLYGEMIRKYACKILEYDRSLTPFQYIGSEKLVNSTLAISDGRKIRLKGFIDRIDKIGDTLRIVDYKSGKANSLNFDTTESLFDITAKDRKKAIMQVFLYSWIYDKMEGFPIQPSVYYARNLFSRGFNPAIYKKEGKENILVNNFANYRTVFEESLRMCLNEMFDAGKPFTQTSNIQNCKHCPFTGICGK